MSSNEANVSRRYVWFDLYVDGKYHSSYDDQCDFEKVAVAIEAGEVI